MTQVEIYSSIVNIEGMEASTYGIKINDIIFNDISTDFDTVNNLVNLINSMMSGDESSRELIHEMIVNTVASYGL